MQRGSKQKPHGKAERMHSAATINRKGRPNKKRKTKKLVVAQRPPKSPKQWALVCLKWGAISGLAMAAIFMATVATLFWVYGRDAGLPNISKLDDYNPSKVSRVVTEDGAVIGEIYEQRRTMVRYEEIPETVIHAFVAAEDASVTTRWQRRAGRHPASRQVAWGPTAGG